MGLIEGLQWGSTDEGTSRNGSSFSHTEHPEEEAREEGGSLLSPWIARRGQRIHEALVHPPAHSDRMGRSGQFVKRASLVPAGGNWDQPAGKKHGLFSIGPQGMALKASGTLAGRAQTPAQLRRRDRKLPARKV